MRRAMGIAGALSIVGILCLVGISPSIREAESAPQVQHEQEIPETLPYSERVQWGELPKHFLIEKVSLESTDRRTEALTFIVTAREEFDAKPYRVAILDSERIAVPDRRLRFTPSKRSWSKGERARVGVELPQGFSEAGIVK